MDQETADELARGQAHCLLAVAGLDPVILPAEDDRLGVRADQATVGDRHPASIFCGPLERKTPAEARRVLEQSAPPREMLCAFGNGSLGIVMIALYSRSTINPVAVA